ncbi:MAG: hypothetical protein K1X55_06910 [Chitinophagales bacterium]|nr:hypothetical protein [Chitinophagales bacterium]
MKKSIYLMLFVCLMLACKKESTTTETPTILTSITYTHPTNAAQNKVFRIYRNTNKLIDSVVLTGADAGAYKRLVFYHTGERLDSVLQYNASNILSFSSKATWSGNNLTAFWTLTYLYDSENRIIKKTYTDGAYFSVTHSADSSVYQYDEAGANPAYVSYVQYYNKSVKNPFRIYKYENAYAMNNFVFNGISSDFNGMYPYAYGNFNEYNQSGALIYSGTYNYSGNFNGYPTTAAYVFNGNTAYTLTFAYE